MQPLTPAERAARINYYLKKIKGNSAKKPKSFAEELAAANKHVDKDLKDYIEMKASIGGRRMSVLVRLDELSKEENLLPLTESINLNLIDQEVLSNYDRKTSKEKNSIEGQVEYRKKDIMRNYDPTFIRKDPNTEIL
jgi:hypothetical protein